MNLQNLVELEWAERTKNGLPPYHALDTTDLGFKFVDVLQHLNDTPSQQATKAFLTGDYETYERMNTFMYTHVSSTCIFNKEFMEYCKKPVEYDLPEVKTIKPIPMEGRRVFLASDGKYFEEFGQYLLKTLDNDIDVMVHLMDPTDEQLSLAKKLCTEDSVGLTVEYPEAGPGYYHAVRLIRFAEMVKKVPTVLLDVDALARNPVSWLPEVPCGMRLRPARLEPWNQFNASVIVGDWRAEQYYNMVAKYIYHFTKARKLLWGIDQAALFCVWTYLKNWVECLGTLEVDYDYQDEGIVWCNSGKNKWMAEDPSREKYREFLEEVKGG